MYNVQVPHQLEESQPTNAGGGGGGGGSGKAWGRVEKHG